jgi:hypothetical protein
MLVYQRVNHINDMKLPKVSRDITTVLLASGTSNGQGALDVIQTPARPQGVVGITW